MYSVPSPHKDFLLNNFYRIISREKLRGGEGGGFINPRLTLLGHYQVTKQLRLCFNITILYKSEVEVGTETGIIEVIKESDPYPSDFWRCVLARSSSSFGIHKI